MEPYCSLPRFTGISERVPPERARPELEEELLVGFGDCLDTDFETDGLGNGDRKREEPPASS